MPRTLRSTLILTSSILIGGYALSQDAAPATSDKASSITLDQRELPPDGLTPDGVPRGKTSLVRGVLKRWDPVHDQLLIRAFGGGDVRVAFDPRTQMLAGDQHTPFTSLPVGSVVSVDTVMNGGIYYSAGLATHLTRPLSPSMLLTPREKEVLARIAGGKSNKLIARELDLSVRTVETHRWNIKRKLGIEGQAELIRFALEQSIGI